MIIFPFSKKLDKGTHDIAAVGNILADDSPLLVVKIELSSSLPILVKIISTKESNLNGEDISEMTANSRISRPVPPMTFKILSEPKVLSEINEEMPEEIPEEMPLVTLIKQAYISYPYNCVDEKDGIILDPFYFLIVRIITQEKTIIAGNIVFHKQSMNFYE